MYDYIPFILGGILVILGGAMIIWPKACAAKEKREDLTAVAKIKRSGVLEVVLGVVLIAVGCWRLTI